MRTMSPTLLTVLLALVVMAGSTLYFIVSLEKKIAVSQRLISEARPFVSPSTDTATTLLVLGDSTAVGVGAKTPEDSVAGRVALYSKATYVENYAVSGATVSDLLSQIKQAKRDHYSLILILIGGNDIIRFHSATKSADTVARALEALPRSDTTLLAGPGNVGGATLFPFFMRPFYTNLNLAYHAQFEMIAKTKGASYVNLYETPSTDPFIKQPKVYLAEDGLHPSSEGY